MIVGLLLAMLAQATPPRDTSGATPAAAGVISGIVLAEEAPLRPLRRVRVSLTGAAADGERTVFTGDDGTFVFPAVAPGRYTVTARRDAFVAVAHGSWRAGAKGQAVTLARGEQKRLELRLQRGAVITGAVFDVDGTPMSGIDVRAYERHFFGLAGEYRYVDVGAVSLVTDDRGVYRIFGLPPGDYFVAAGTPAPARAAAVSIVRMAGDGDRRYRLARVFYPSAVDPARAARVTVRAGEERSGVDVQLQYVPLASISGTVQVPPGRGAPEIVLASAAAPGVTDNGVSASLGADGRFTFTSLAPGDYRVVARSTSGLGTLAAAVDVTLDGEDVDNVTLSLQPTRAISGMVVFRGETAPPPFGRSTSAPPLAAAMHDGAMPPLDLDGVRFRLQGILPGGYRVGTNILGVRTPLAGWWLTSIASGDVQLLDTPVDGSRDIQDAVATLSDRASTLSGVVADADGGPHPDATVVAFSRDRAGWFYQSWRVRAANSDEQGRFVIRNLPPGDYLLAAAVDLVSPEWFDPDVLQRLSAGAVPFTVTGAETQTHDLVIR